MNNKYLLLIILVIGLLIGICFVNALYCTCLWDENERTGEFSCITVTDSYLIPGYLDEDYNPYTGSGEYDGGSSYDACQSSDHPVCGNTNVVVQSEYCGCTCPLGASKISNCTIPDQTVYVGQTKECWNTNSVGSCYGRETCDEIEREWTDCTAREATIESSVAKTCQDKIDNDCDGKTDTKDNPDCPEICFYKTSEGYDVETDTTYNTCCSSQTDCVKDSICYPEKTILNYQTDEQICYAGKWYDPDVRDSASVSAITCGTYGTACYCLGTCLPVIENNCSSGDNNYCSGTCNTASYDYCILKCLFVAKTKSSEIQDHKFSNEESFSMAPLNILEQFVIPSDDASDCEWDCAERTYYSCLQVSPICSAGCLLTDFSIPESPDLCIYGNLEDIINDNYDSLANPLKCCGDDTADFSDPDCDPCIITSTSLTSGTFGKDQSITATITYTGDCSAANLAQVDLYTATTKTIYDEDGDEVIVPECKIQYTGEDMQGMTKTPEVFSSSGGTSSITYTIPTIPDECAGKTLTKTDAAFYQGTPLTGTVKSNYYSGIISPITLNQCYGYTWADYPGSWSQLFDVTKDGKTKYWATCYNNLIKKDVIILNQWVKATTKPVGIERALS